MIPVIALVGRPNVGKSTLFNRLTRSRDALVANVPGLTRDRQYGEGRYGERRFIAIDTGGIQGSEEGIDYKMAEQSLLAIAESDLVLFLVDARAGLTPGDQYIADYLRRQGKPAWLVVNKTDGLDPALGQAEFYALGFEHIHPIAASQGRGVKQLMDKALALFPEQTAEAPDSAEAEKARGVKIAVAGRPNVGKSTLVNRLLGEERVVVFDMPGTTRDSVYIPFERHGKAYTLIDTAGIRRRGRTRETVEKFSVVKSLQAIQDANVVVLLLDAREGIVDQDLHLIGYVIESGRALVIALNKWDGMDLYAKDRVKQEIQRRLGFADFASIHFISALHGTGVGELYRSIDKAWESASRALSTSKLTQILERAVADHAPPLVNGRRIKLRYAHAGGHNPPLVVIHGKQTDALAGHYLRYLEKTFREALDLRGTPVRIELRSDANPFVKGEEALSPREIARKRRIQRSREFDKERTRKAPKGRSPAGKTQKSGSKPRSR